MKKIALIVGHSFLNQGAINYKNETEYIFNYRVACKIEELINKMPKKIDAKVFFREKESRVQLAHRVVNYNPDIAIELHFNSFKDEVFGCESKILSKDRRSLDFCEEFIYDFSCLFNIGRRHINGVDGLEEGDRGFLNLKLLETIPIKFIFEPCFANFKNNESEAIFENEERYVEFIATYLRDYWCPKEPVNVKKIHNMDESQLSKVINETNEYDLPGIPENDYEEKYNKLADEVDMLKNILTNNYSSRLTEASVIDNAISVITQLSKEASRYKLITDKQKASFDELLNTMQQAIDKCINQSNSAWKDK